MRRRPKLVLFLSVVAVGSVTLLISYLILVHEMRGSPAPHPDRESDQMQASVQARLIALEQQLLENQQLLTHVRRRVVQMSRSIGSKRRVSRNNRSEETCPPGVYWPPDVSVEQMYEEISFDNTDGGAWKQGWPIEVDARRRSGPRLQVFVVPHSHNDPGWIKTFDAYFRTQTRLILSNMLSFLTQHPSMRFIWAETSYFAYWWDTLASDSEKNDVRSLLKNGQLEIVSGGWVMNDEANPHISAIVSQMVEGHEWLKRHVDYVPRNGWSIDPFGLSPTMAYVSKKSGMRGLVIQRVHYSIKKYLASKQLLEFRWRQYWEADDTEDIVTHVMPFFSYDAPHSCGPDPKVCCQFDFARTQPVKMSCPWKVNPRPVTSANVASQAALLADQYWKKAMLYKSNSILVPLGDDFRYDKMREWHQQYDNYQKLFEFMNSSPDLNMNVRFGTLADYFASIQNETYPSLTGDFFTYADRDDHYWSGYYTTRPFYKRFDRILESLLRSSEILFTWNSILDKPMSRSKAVREQLEYARQSLALFQHHDAITGTARSHVVNDYAQRMYTSIIYSQSIIEKMVHSLVTGKQLKPSPQVPQIQSLDLFPDRNSLSKTRVLHIQTDERIALLAFNSLSHSRHELLCFRIAMKSRWTLFDSSGKQVTVQISYVWQDHELLADEVEVCFMAFLEAVSVSHFTIVGQESSDSLHFSHVTLFNFKSFDLPDNEFISKKETNDEIVVQTDVLRLVFSGKDGMLKRTIIPDELRVYESSLQYLTFGTRNNKNEPRSGAYLFLPDTMEAKRIAFKSAMIRVTEGDVFTRVECIQENPVTVTTKFLLIPGKRVIGLESEFYLTRGSFFSNKELLMRLSTEVISNDTFFTDLNGFQMIKRKRFAKIPVQGNVYPVPTLIYIEDEMSRVSVIGGQALGGTSPASGVMDLFLDRHLLQDDQRGMGQGVTDNRRTRLSFKVMMEKKSPEQLKPSLSVQQELHRLLHPVHLLKYSGNISADETHSLFLKSTTCDVHLLNFRTCLFSRKYHLTLHRFAVSCDSRCDSKSQFTPSDFFPEKMLAKMSSTFNETTLTQSETIRRNIPMNQKQVIDAMEIAVFEFSHKDET